MLIRVTPSHPIAPSEITDEATYRNRRVFLREAGLLGLIAAGVPRVARAMNRTEVPARPLSAGQGTVGAVTMGEGLRENLTRWDDVNGYKNFY